MVVVYSVLVGICSHIYSVLVGICSHIYSVFVKLVVIFQINVYMYAVFVEVGSHCMHCICFCRYWLSLIGTCKIGKLMYIIYLVSVYFGICRIEFEK